MAKDNDNKPPRHLEPFPDPTITDTTSSTTGSTQHGGSLSLGGLLGSGETPHPPGGPPDEFPSPHFKAVCGSHFHAETWEGPERGDEEDALRDATEHNLDCELKAARVERMPAV